jgi:hypothetical protein
MHLPGDIKMIVPKGRGVDLHLSVMTDSNERFLVMSTYDNHTHKYTAHEWCPVTPQVDSLVSAMEQMGARA